MKSTISCFLIAQNSAHSGVDRHAFCSSSTCLSIQKSIASTHCCISSCFVIITSNKL
jgi:hypothetical protein